MILKHADDKLPALLRLEALVKAGRIPPDQVVAVEQALRSAHAAIRGERDAAALLDAWAQESSIGAVIHDLHLALPDRQTAQLDHVIIQSGNRFHVLDTRYFTHGLKITGSGEFLRWNNWKKTFEGIPSPIEQGRQHALVLGKVVESLGLPAPRIRNFVLVAQGARIDRSEGFDSALVVTPALLVAALRADPGEPHRPGIVGGVPRSARRGQLQETGNRLIALHRPPATDTLADLGIRLLPARQQLRPARRPAEVTVPPQRSVRRALASKWPDVACQECQGSDLSIHAGRHGYYFRCHPCQVNTAIRLACGQAGHQERLRKDGAQYFRECAACGTSRLYFESPPN